MGFSNSTLVLPLLQQTLKDENEYVRAGTVQALAQFAKTDAEAIYPLIKQAFKDPHKYVRNKVVEILGTFKQLNAHETLPLLQKALQDPDPHVIEESIKALGEIDPQQALIALKNVCHSPHQNVREAIPEVITQILRKNPTLCSAAFPIITISCNDRLDTVRRKIMNTIGEMGQTDPTTAIQLLRYGLVDLDKFVGEAAAMGLGVIGKIHPTWVISELKNILDNYMRGGDVRYGAAIGLGIMGKNHPDTVLPILRGAFDDSSEYVRSGLAEALTYMQDVDLQCACPFILKSIKEARGDRLRGSAIRVASSLDWSQNPEIVKYFIQSIDYTYTLAKAAKKHFLASTLLISLVKNYLTKPSDHTDYLLAIALKCVDENRTIFLKDQRLCVYENNKLYHISNISDLDQRILHIQQAIEQFPAHLKSQSTN